MAIIFETHTQCCYCSDSIKAKDIVVFPAFITSTTSKFYRLNDSVWHKVCLEKDSDYLSIITLFNEYKFSITPRNRKCFLDGTLITDPNDHLFIDYITDNKENFIHELRFKNFKLSNLKSWNDLDRFTTSLIELKKENGAIQYIDFVLKRIS